MIAEKPCSVGPLIICGGHTELRDMVIELRADVKHIDDKICDLVAIASKNNERICNLEVYQNQTIGEAKGVRSSAIIVSAVISIVGMIIAIYISLVVR